MWKDFDEVFGVKTEETKPAEVNVPTDNSLVEHLPESEFDPPAPVDPNAIPVEPDNFTKQLDEMIREAGLDPELEKRRRYNPSAKDVNQHDWYAPQERLFSSGPYKFRCKRCLKWAVVKAEETISEVLERDGIDPNCAAIMIQDIMSS